MEKNLVNTILANEALENGRMLTVDRQDGYMVAQGGFGDDATGHHHGFLVGQGNGMAILDGMESGAQAGKTYDGGQDKVDRRHFHEVDNSFLAGIDFDATGLECLADKGILTFVGNSHGIGFELKGLPDKHIGIAAST